MPNVWPMLGKHALAAAVFAVVFAVAMRFMGGDQGALNSIVLLGLVVAYAILVNRWVAKDVPKPPFAQPRKGSHKPQKGGRWKSFRWVLTVMVSGLAVQMATFVAVYFLVYALSGGWS